MRVFNVTDSWSEETALLRADVRPDGAAGAPMEIWYRFEGLDGPLEATADPFVAAMVPSCMYDAEPIEVDGHASDILTDNLSFAQDMLSSWYDFLTPVPVASQRHDGLRPMSRASGVACCFSGGVDSWYSLLKHRGRVTHLFLVRGFDIGLDNDALWQTTKSDAAAIARHLGKRLITCETNLRQIADRGRANWGQPFTGDFWGRILHGAALTSCALALQRTIGELIVPATHATRQLKPWGSSPHLDPHWSNGAIDVTHDGCEAERLEKVRNIASFDLALQTLRVCHHDTAQTNCGKCEKCIRTMLQLHLCNALARAGAFRGHDPFRKLNRLEVPEHLVHHYRSLLHEAYRVDDRQVFRAVETIMGHRFSVERTLAKAIRRARRLGATHQQPEREPARNAEATRPPLQP